MPWRSLLALHWPIPGHEIGLPGEVRPMGWLSAVSLFPASASTVGPHAGARRCRFGPNCGEGIVLFLQVRRHLGVWVQYYLDDFDATEFVPRSKWKQLQGVLSATHRRQRDAYSRQGVEISFGRWPRGCSCRWRQRVHFGSSPKAVETDYMAVWLLSSDGTARKPLLMVLGTWGC